MGSSQCSCQLLDLVPGNLRRLMSCLQIPVGCSQLLMQGLQPGVLLLPCLRSLGMPGPGCLILPLQGLLDGGISLLGGCQGCLQEIRVSHLAPQDTVLAHAQASLTEQPSCHEIRHINAGGHGTATGKPHRAANMSTEPCGRACQERAGISQHCMRAQTRIQAAFCLP